VATVLTYRNDGDRPFCEIALNGGERVQVELGGEGLVISQPGQDARPAEVLFQGDAELVADLCGALFGSAIASSKSPLDLLMSVVMQLRSAREVRDAFHAAEQAL